MNDYKWAMEAVKNGAVVRRSGWMPDKRIRMADNGIEVLGAKAKKYRPTENDKYAGDWEEVR